MQMCTRVCKWLPKEHPLYPQRFSKASYKVMLNSYLRVLDPVTGVCPSSKRIVQDITRCWGEHLDKICETKGGAVKDLGNRVGKRKLEGLKKAQQADSAYIPGGRALGVFNTTWQPSKSAQRYESQPANLCRTS